jgi:ABC-type transport system involved in cytochrome bd biosynthesis fused ATPase/permease subunit
VPGPIDRRLTQETSTTRRHLLAGGTLAVAEALLIVAQAALLAAIIAAAAIDHASLRSLRGELIALGVVLAARAVVRAGFELNGRRAATGVISQLRGRLVDRLVVGSPGCRPGGARTGDLASSAVAGVDALESYFAGYLPQMLLATTVPVAVLVWVATIDPLIAGLMAATIPILIGFMILVGKGTRAQTRSRHVALALLSAHFLDVVSGLETLRSYRRETVQQRTLASVGERYITPCRSTSARR